MAIGYIPPKDNSGRPINRNAATESGWAYVADFLQFETSQLNSLRHTLVDGTDSTYCSIKFYDASDVELTTQPAIDASCVKTVVDFAPPYDYELIGGSFRQYTSPLDTDNCFLWVSQILL